MTDAYPLRWPDGWPRTPDHKREDGRSRFRKGDWRGGYKNPGTAERARELIEELARMGARSVVVSSNVRLRQDGLPYSNQRMPDDPGVAVYFVRDGKTMAMARDAFHRVEDNLRSLTLAVQGLRQMERHGGSAMTARAFDGFAALPPPPDVEARRNWRSVLNVGPEADLATVRRAYRRRAQEEHPDNGGSADRMAAVNLAWEQAQKEITE